MQATVAFNQQRKEKFRLWWDKFSARFPDDDTCLREISLQLSLASTRCSCGAKISPGTGRSTKCPDCGEVCWLTKGTFFERKHCLQAWLAAIYAMDEKILFNAKELEEATGVAYSTAFLIFKTLSFIVKEASTGKDIHSRHLLEIISKRSRKTPKDKHPSAEQDDMELECANKKEEKSGQGKTGKKSRGRPGSKNPATEDGLSADDLKVLRALSKTPQSIDTLCKKTGLTPGAITGCLTMLELNGLIESLPGGRFILREKEPSKRSENRPTVKKLSAKLERAVKGLTKIVRCLFHGSSRKNLQLNVAAVEYMLGERRKSKRSLLHLCNKFGPVKYKELRDYNTPLSVKIPHSVPNLSNLID